MAKRVNTPEPFATPRRQELLGILIFFVDNLRKLVRLIIGIVAGAVINPNVLVYLWAIALVSLGLLGVFSWFQYRRFTFFISNDALKIAKGVFVRDNITIPFDRIQTVHLHQNVVQQVLGLTGVKVDTAGSAQKELQVHALLRKDAVLLQQLLQARGGSSPQSEEAEGSLESTTEPSRQPKEILVRLGLARLLVVGLTQNHIRNGFLAIGFVFGTFFQMEEWIERSVEQVPDETLDSLRALGMLLVVLGVVLFLVLSVVVSLVQVVLRHYNLEARLDGQAFEVVAGLLKRNEHSIPLRKVQFIEWKGNWLRRIPGFETVQVFQGRSQESVGRGQHVSIPAVYPEQTERVMATVFSAPGDLAGETFRPHAFYRILIFLYSQVPALPVWVVWGFMPSQLLLPALGAVYAGIAYFWTGRYFRSMELRVGESLMIYRRGWAFTRRTVLPLHKLQTVALRQNIFQFRRGVAHLTLFTAGGSRTLRYIRLEDAQRLSDYLLYRTEAYSGSWM